MYYKIMVMQNKTHVHLVPLIQKPNLEVIMFEHSPGNIADENENKNKVPRRLQECNENDSSTNLCKNSDTKPEQISESDLEELRTVYIKCKSVLRKIEQKYGHLLKINQRDTTEEESTEDSDQQCICAFNKKIVFDEDGKESTIETDLSSHICPKKLKISQSRFVGKSIKIEYDTPDTLPDDLQLLSKLLRNQNLEATFRHKIIYKMRSIKQENINEFKLHKQALVEKSKLNPDDVIYFRGTNLSTLKGYPMQ